MNKKYISYGGLEINQYDINKLRNLSILCAKNINVQNYIKNTCLLIKELINDYAKANINNINVNSKKMNINDFTNYIILSKLHINNITSAGQVSGNIQVINDVINNGNIREQMTLISNFAKSSCEIMLWCILNNYKLLNSNYIKFETYRLQKLTGLNIKEIYKLFNKCDKRTCPLPCSFTNLFMEGPVSISRINNVYPMTVSVRSERKLIDREKFRIKMNEIYPPLSEREIKFMKIQNNNSIIPWISGYMLFDIDKNNLNNIYNRIALEYKQLIISGPSGNTDLCLSALMMFKNFNIEIACLSFIAWMCNPPDHSAYEILMACIPFGLKFSSNKDAFIFVQELNNKYQTNIKNNNIIY